MHGSVDADRARQRDPGRKPRSGLQLLSTRGKEYSPSWTQGELFTTLLRSRPTFLSHRREKQNFRRSNMDPQLRRPPNYPAERWVVSGVRATLYRLLFFSD